jgi:hypothetical protein
VAPQRSTFGGSHVQLRSFTSQKKWLRRVLGEHYNEKYSVMLDFIWPEDIEGVQYLGQGRNGCVLSALWNRPGHGDIEERQAVDVVIKYAHENANGDDLIVKFLQEA